MCVRLQTNQPLPGLGNGNEPMTRPPPSETAAHIRAALQVLRDGFAFVGLTEAWTESVSNFHAQFMPSVPIAPEQELLGEGHLPGSAPAPPTAPAFYTLEDTSSILNSNRVETDLAYDALWFPHAEGRRVVEHDPDLLVFAHARLAFCCAEVRRLGAAHPALLPTVCLVSLGSKVGVTAAEQRAWAAYLLSPAAWGNQSVDIRFPPREAVLESLAGEDLRAVCVSLNREASRRGRVRF